MHEACARSGRLAAASPTPRRASWTAPDPSPTRCSAYSPKRSQAPMAKARCAGASRRPDERLEPFDLKIVGRRYGRVLHGEEEDGAAHGGPCPDCGVQVGEPHRMNCDVERCPRCKAQLRSCPCEPVEDAW